MSELRRSARSAWAGVGMLAGSVALAGFAAPALAQQAPPAATQTADDEADMEYEVEELVVTGAQRPRGSVIGDIPPEFSLGPREIRALGVGSVAELLTALEPQLASGRGRGGGRPVMLVNGQRISGFSEIRDLPPEAIVRVDILPEEVALKYGYRADQRVVNFVLRRRFRALTAEAGVRAPTDGGRVAGDLDLTALRLQGDTRLQVAGEVNHSTRLLESERDVDARDAGAVDERPFRTLLPETTEASLNAVYSRPLGEGQSATVNARLEATESGSLLGLPGDGVLGPPFSALGRTRDTLSGHLGLAGNGAVSGWRWSATANADRTRTRSLTEPDLDAETLAWQAPDRAVSTLTTADAEAVLNGVLFDLPAGGLNASFTAGAQHFGIESNSVLRGERLQSDLSRDVGRLQANFDIPIASRRSGVLQQLGNLSLNFNGAVEELSDFGTLTTVGAGVNWSPIEAVRLIASVTEEEGAPTIQQLGDPEIETHNVRVFDFRSGETVEVTQVEGGNPELQADNRRVMKLGLTVRPVEDTDLVFRADYTRSRIRDVISAFPAPTAEIEAAFSERFTRDAAGQLLRIDVRPVNFARHEREELRYGFNYSRPLRNTRPPPFVRRVGPGGAAGGQGGAPGSGAGQVVIDGPASPDSAAPRRFGGGEGPGAGRGGGGFRGMGGGRGGALQFAVFHTVRLEDEILVAPGGPVLDLLEGSALSETGGEPRHQVDVQAGVSRNGLGARLTARWRSGTELHGARFGGQDLTFSDLTTVNLRLFADLGFQPFARNNPWLRGSRVTLSVDNLFDERVRVRTSAGDTPIRYQPEILDPLGRTVRLSFRKIFF